MAMTCPREYGGGGRPLIDAILVVEEIAKVCGTVARIVVDGQHRRPQGDRGGTDRRTRSAGSFPASPRATSR